jgi:hypothetical protein
MTPAIYESLTQKEKVKYLLENPEFREKLAGGMMKR